MTNYEAIIQMPLNRIEQFLDQVYLAGLNTGMYAATQEDDKILDQNSFDERWLADSAEEATEFGFAEDGDEYLLSALAEAILRSAGISMTDDDH